MRSLSVLAFSLLIAGSAFAQQKPSPTPPAPPPPAPAPPAPAPRAKAATLGELDGRVAKLGADVDELKRLTVEFPSLQQTVNSLAAQVTAMKQDVETFRRVNQAKGDEIARLDQLDARVAELTQQVASVRAEVQAQGAPENGAPFGGATYREGFVLATDNGAYALRLTGYVQPRYTLRLPEGNASDVEESGFNIHQARLGVDGHVFSPRLEYRFLTELASANVQLLDAFVQGELHAMVSLRAGQFKNPFSRSWLNLDNELSFVERSVATEEFRYDRDLGIMAILHPHERIGVDLAVLNGAGPNVAGNDNIDPLLVARVDGTVLGETWRPEEGDFDNTPSPALMVGVAATFENTPVPTQYGYQQTAPLAQAIDNPDVDGDLDRDNVRVLQLALDVALRWRGLGVEGEAYFRKEDWGTIGQAQTPAFTPEESYQGGFVQATYFLVPGRYQLGARASFAEVSPLTLGGRHRPAARCTIAGMDAACELPVSDLRTEFTVLAAYYRYRHGVELTAMYSFLDWASRDGADPADAGEHRFLVETQLSF